MRRAFLLCVVLSLSQIMIFIILTFIRKSDLYMNLWLSSEWTHFPRDQRLGSTEQRWQHQNKTTASLKAAVTTALMHSKPTEITPFSLSLTRRKSRLKLIVAILSAPTRTDRRQGIRRTWKSDCNSPDVLCRFFTDSLSALDESLRNALIKENGLYGDVEFMSVPRGFNFARRFLWILEWSTRNYEFDFVLRIDDDYFLCLGRLLAELPQRAKTPRLYWGYIHCVTEGQVRVDEGFLLLSADLVNEFVGNKSSLLCHPFGDQAVAMWLNNRTDVTRFHDPRVVHTVTSTKPEFKKVKNLCGTYLALHGSYLHDNLIYWNNVKSNLDMDYWVPSIQPFHEVCKLSTFFDWRKMVGKLYRWEPKPCATNTVWDFGGYKMHIGRSRM
ncbi:beta-1,3-galactosyltransferase 6 [Nematostella vectensis]|uniref:beta-1,3-galactosyltransferase 6 n=1 Tax=Nematostella vectensis TaxID=45351 RepID=UPI0020775BA4|nr:beta-1,3-galactosyltransferase 6 [Nematostella vectensis]